MISSFHLADLGDQDVNSSCRPLYYTPPGYVLDQKRRVGAYEICGIDPRSERETAEDCVSKTFICDAKLHVLIFTGPFGPVAKASDFY